MTLPTVVMGSVFSVHYYHFAAVTRFEIRHFASGNAPIIEGTNTSKIIQHNSMFPQTNPTIVRYLYLG